VRKLREEIARRRRRVEELQAAQQEQRGTLTRAKHELQALTERIHSLETGQAKQNQELFVLLNELDRMQALESRVTARARKLAEAAAVAETPTTRRSAPRATLVTEVNLEGDNNFFVGYSQDVAEGGLFVATPDPLPIRARVLLTLTLPGTAEPIRCMAEVAWVREYHEGSAYENGAVPGMGMQFIGLSAIDRDKIGAFVKEREALFYPEDDLEP